MYVRGNDAFATYDHPFGLREHFQVYDWLCMDGEEEAEQKAKYPGGPGSACQRHLMMNLLLHEDANPHQCDP